MLDRESARRELYSEAFLIKRPPLQAIVYSKGGRQVGVVVDRILDTIDERVSTLHPDSGPAWVGTVVIDGHVTQIIDLDALCPFVVRLPEAASGLAGSGI